MCLLVISELLQWTQSPPEPRLPNSIIDIYIYIYIYNPTVCHTVTPHWDIFKSWNNYTMR